eukprot:432668-Pleurochrysis_carterae.AAC.1
MAHQSAWTLGGSEETVTGQIDPTATRPVCSTTQTSIRAGLEPDMLLDARKLYGTASLAGAYSSINTQDRVLDR